LASPLVEWNSRHPQIRRCIHWLHLEAIVAYGSIVFQLDAECRTPDATPETSVASFRGESGIVKICERIFKDFSAVLLASDDRRQQRIAAVHCGIEHG
jgi:hypothetical protein